MLKVLMISWVLVSGANGVQVLDNDKYIAGPNGDRGGITDPTLGQSAADRALRSKDDRGGIRDRDLGWSAARRALGN